MAFLQYTEVLKWPILGYLLGKGNNGEWLLISKHSPWDDENFLELDSGDGSTILWVYLK